MKKTRYTEEQIIGARSHHAENLQKVQERSAWQAQSRGCRWGLWIAYGNDAGAAKINVHPNLSPQG